jgi:cardiolipin synthase
MDPLADKMLILSAFVALALMDVVPRWLAVIVISRDVIILLGYLSLFLLTQQLMEIRPSAISKAATFLDLVTLSTILLSLWRADLTSAGTRQVLFVITGTVTTVSGIHYIYRGLRWYQQKGGTPAPESPR